MKPLAAHSPRTRLMIAWTIAGSVLALLILVAGLWLVALAARSEARSALMSDVSALQNRVMEARAEAQARPDLALVSDRDIRASLREPDAARALLTAQAQRLAGALETAGLAVELQEHIEQTRLGGIDEVRTTLSARGEAGLLLQALAAHTEPDLRVFSLRLEPLPGGEARLVMVLVRAVGEGGENAP